MPALNIATNSSRLSTSSSASTPKAGKRRPVSMYAAPSPGSLEQLSPPADAFRRDRGMSQVNLQQGVQDENVLRLSQQVQKLQDELDERPTVDAMERLHKEWQTSEELFDQSQRDNAQKQITIESLRNYVKALECKLEETLGDDWKDYCRLPSVQEPSNSFAASTPLPKPALRSSASIKRASRHARAVSTNDAQFHLRDVSFSAEPATPAAALRKLEGIQEFETPQQGRRQPVARTASSPLSKSFPANAQDVERRPTHGSAVDPLSAEHLMHLLTSIQTLPDSVLSQLESARAKNDQERLDKHKALQDTITKVLDEAEERAKSRELRIQALLEEAKSHSDSIAS